MSIISNPSKILTFFRENRAKIPQKISWKHWILHKSIIKPTSDNLKYKQIYPNIQIALNWSPFGTHAINIFANINDFKALTPITQHQNKQKCSNLIFLTQSHRFPHKFPFKNIENERRTQIMRFPKNLTAINCLRHQARLPIFLGENACERCSFI